MEDKGTPSNAKNWTVWTDGSGLGDGKVGAVGGWGGATALESPGDWHALPPRQE